MINYIKKHIYVIPAGIIILLLIIYLVLCLLAGSGDFYSNITINNVDVSHMSKEDVITKLTNQYEEDTKDLKMNLIANDKTYSVDMKDNLSCDIEKGSEEIYKQINNGFFMKGYYAFFKNNFTIAVNVKDDETLEKSIKSSKVLSYDTKENTTYKVQDNSLLFTKGKSGEKTDKDSIITSIKDSLANYNFKEDIKCQLVSSEADDDVDTLYNSINQEAQNATLDKDNDYAIVDGVVGVKMDKDTFVSEYNKASEGSEFEVSATITQPTIDKENLEKNLFKDKMGSYSTYVSGTSVRKNNVKLAGEKCNTILLPGEQFSYNDIVGQRTKENGFGEAGAYVNGETVQEVGGGVCQTSSTLYNAVVLANLEIVERTNHTYISSYVPIGRDATVSWGGPDFKFKNNTDYPIKIEVTYSNSRLYCNVYGTDLENTTVEFTNEVLSYVEPTVKYVKDDTLEEGKEKVESSGSRGAKAQTYRKVYKNGVLVSTTKESYSSYKAHEKVVRKGTKKVEKKEETKKDETKTDEKKQTTEKKTTTEDSKKTEESSEKKTESTQDSTN
jgi:vancomycin resistance protein YoaR